jgi:hypothetical protein
VLPARPPVGCIAAGGGQLLAKPLQLRSIGRK